MGKTTSIEWCDHTFNFGRGCSKVSAGCANCYAEALSKRNPAVLGVWGESGTRVVASEVMWEEPPKWDWLAREAGERRRVFCASLADVFEDRPEWVEPRRRLFKLIEESENLDWLLLTKRPENVSGMSFRRWWLDDWPRNLWLGVSVENQETANRRIPILLDIPAAVRFVSAEPLLGPIDFYAGWLGWKGERMTPVGPMVWVAPAIDWLILGGESGPKARPCNIDWIRSGVKQCREAGVAPFVKQLGARPFVDVTGGHRYDDHTYFKSRDPKGGDPAEWPEDLRIREIPRGSDA